MSAFQRFTPAGTVQSWAYKFSLRGRQIYRSGFPTKSLAERAEAADRRARAEGMVAEMESMTRRRGAYTVGHAIEGYLTAGCPDRDGQPRRGCTSVMETRNCGTLLRWWSTRSPDGISEATQRDYAAWRAGTVNRGRGGLRMAELELVTLRNALRFAASRGEVKVPPLTQIRLRRPEQIRHARDFAPASGDELHRIASFLLGWTKTSQVYGWAVLMGALTGLREGELAMLRACPPRSDPHNRPAPGHWDDRWLYVQREKKGLKKDVRLDDPERPHIRAVLAAILAWKGGRYPGSPWLLPNADGGQLQHASISKMLGKAVSHLQLPERHAHGLRAFYSSVRLAQGHGPEQIALELGQRSGADLVRSTYGCDPEEFEGDRFTSLANVLTWIPTRPGLRPAWDLHATTLATGSNPHQTPPNTSKVLQFPGQATTEAPATQLQSAGNQAVHP